MGIVFDWIMDELIENVEFGGEGYVIFDQESFLEGYLMLVFFGLVLCDYGIEEIFDFIVDFVLLLYFQLVIGGCIIMLGEDKVIGFVFKVQVNMDFKYWDCIVFVWLCLGMFKCGMKLKYVCVNK